MKARYRWPIVIDEDPAGLRHAAAAWTSIFFSELKVVEIDRMTNSRILIACIGNIFLGDDGFGMEVARRFAGSRLPPGVVVKDFGIRGFDLTYSLLEPYGSIFWSTRATRLANLVTLYLSIPIHRSGMRTIPRPAGNPRHEPHGRPSRWFTHCGGPPARILLGGL